MPRFDRDNGGTSENAIARAILERLAARFREERQLMRFDFPSNLATSPGQDADFVDSYSALDESQLAPLESLRLSDADIAYAHRLRPAFDDLKGTMSQIAGLLVLAATLGKSISGHPMLAVASDAYRRARETILSTVAPDGSRHLRFHVMRALHAVDDALKIVRDRTSLEDTEIDAATALLRLSYDELRITTPRVPGSALVALSMGCGCFARARSKGACQ